MCGSRTLPAELPIAYVPTRLTGTAASITSPPTPGCPSTRSHAPCPPPGAPLLRCPKTPSAAKREAGVFLYVQAYAALSGPVTGAVDYSWTGSWGVPSGRPANN